MVTQAGAVAALGRSQPTISRAIAQLERQGFVRGRFGWSGSRTGREWSYGLTSPGERAALQAITDARALPTVDPELRLGDLLDLHGTLTLTDLLSLPVEDRNVGTVTLRRQLSARRVRFRERGAPESSIGQPSELVGRWVERREILRALGRMQGPGVRGEVRVVLGPAGQGKSRLLRFAEEIARRRGFRVVRGHVTKDAGLPFSPFEEVMAALAADGPERVWGSTRPHALPRRLLGYLELLRQGPPTPLLLILDDLHDARPPALTVFRFLCQNLPAVERPVLLIAAARDDEPRPHRRVGGFGELLADLARPATGLASVLVVPPLSVKESWEVADLSRSGATAPVPDRVVESLIARAHGNPLFIVEAVREAQRAASGTQRGAPHAGRPATPPSLRRLLAVRLEQLPPRHRAVLEACALLDEEFSARPLEALEPLGVVGPPREVARQLRELVDPWAMLVPRGEGRFAFVHALFRESLTDSLADRTGWAAALAAWWERQRPEDVLRIAHLYRMAHDPARALPWLRRALDRTLEEQAYGAVQEIVRGMGEMVELRPRARREFRELEFALVERLWLAGSPVAVTLARNLLEEPLGPRDEIRAGSFLCAALGLRAPDEARRRLADLPARLPAVEARDRNELRGTILAVAAYVHGLWGDWETGLAESETALRLLPRRRTSVWRLSAALSRSFSLSHLRRYREAYRSFGPTARLLPTAGHSVFRVLLLEQQATIASLLGRPAETLRLRDRAVRLSREISNPSVLGEALAGLILSQIQPGTLARARSSLAELRELIDRFGLLQLEPWAEFRRGQILWRSGDRDEAVGPFRAAAAAFRATPRPANALLAEAYLVSRERNPRKILSFRREWLRHEPSLDAEEVSAIEPVRSGSPAFLP